MTDPIHLENRETDGKRLYSPTAGRNSGSISEVLAKELQKNARVLEIGSGTGEHAVAICAGRDDVIWQTSDPDAQSRQSQNAWRLECPERILPSLNLDVTKEQWWTELGAFDSIFAANMIHIAPWEAALGLVKGAAKLLSKSGLVFLYGPFLEGEKTAPSNLKFDATLKSRNPEWGVRSIDSVKHIFADVGFNLRARYEMPAENQILVFSWE